MNQYNIGHTLADTAARAPHRLAILFPVGRDDHGRATNVQLNFQQLNELCDQYAHGLSDYGIRRGERVLMMLRPNVDFIAVAFALLKIGAVPILIDPGMGRRSFLQCVAETEPTAMIGIPLAHALSRIFPQAFKTISRRVTAGRRLLWGGTTLEALRAEQRGPFRAAPTTTEDEAAIAFTSGSTGIPKGVVYLHGIFREQVKILRDEMDFREGDVHLSALLIFALFNPALGVTTIIPDMNPRKPATLNPAYFVESLQTHGVTISLGSPTIFRIVGDYCRQHKITLPVLRQVLMFGAAVPPSLIREFSGLMPNGTVSTPFGATEALPLTSIGDEEIITETRALTEQGAGVCVGRPLGEATIRIIPITDHPIARWTESLPLPPGSVGEVVVKGAVVTRHYLHRPQKTAEAKIYEGEQVWHRMGDIGYFDERGRLWICGRKSHRVETAMEMLLPVQCEAIFNQHPAVARTALVGLGTYGRQQPVLIVELKPERQAISPQAKQALIANLLGMGQKYEHTRPIKTFLFHPSFPVDVRHNAKIQREKLALWAEVQLR